MKLEYGHDSINQTFFILIDEKYKAIITYTIKNNTWYLEHTIVPTELSGKGIATKLAQYVFDYINENQIQYKSICSFLVNYEIKQSLKVR